MRQAVGERIVRVDFSGFLAVGLTLLFVGLKLTGYIDWSWWWVLAPLWIGFAIMLVVLAALGVVLLIAAAIAE